VMVFVGPAAGIPMPHPHRCMSAPQQGLGRLGCSAIERQKLEPVTFGERADNAEANSGTAGVVLSNAIRDRPHAQLGDKSVAAASRQRSPVAGGRYGRGPNGIACGGLSSGMAGREGWVRSGG
jgi:hypothetical protein